MPPTGRPVEPCLDCGRETTSGSRLFSDRRSTTSPEGAALYLCGDCNERAVSHAGRTLDRGDMLRIAARSAGLGMAARGGAGPSSGGGG
jgi:hypothetical protein